MHLYELKKGDIFISHSNDEAPLKVLSAERFFNEADYIRLRDSYILNSHKLENAKKDLVIMHPLPRVNEISVEIDEDQRACYFKQVLNGKFIRMALIMKLLGVK